MPHNDTDVSDMGLNQHDHLLFQRGFKFYSKYIGTMEVPRPVSRLEIVSAMRRIRFDFKARAVRKKSVTMEVSLDGVSVSLHDKQKSMKMQNACESSVPLFKNPIHRIFYVSHDSKDVKIFSYIAKEDETNVFKCSVFKALKKKDAGEIVKTIGQAFEVSHLAHQARKQQQQQQQKVQQQKQLQVKRTKQHLKSGDDDDDDGGDTHTDAHRETHTDTHTDTHTGTDTDTHIYTDINLASPDNGDGFSLLSLALNTEIASENEEETLTTNGDCTDPSNNHLHSHHLHAIKQKVKMKGQENVLLKSQNKMLHKQLQVEIQARKHAEALTERLLSQNRDLFAQIDLLLKKLSSAADNNIYNRLPENNNSNNKSNNKVKCNSDKNYKTRTLDLSLLASGTEEHPRETKNSPDSGLNEMEGSEHQGEGEGMERSEREADKEVDKKKESDAEKGGDSEGRMRTSEKSQVRGIANEGIDSTPVKLKHHSSRLNTSDCNGSACKVTNGSLCNGVNASMSTSANGTGCNGAVFNEKISKQKHLSLSASLYNKVNVKWLQSFGKASKNDTPKKNDKSEKLVRSEKSGKSRSRPVSSVSERLESGRGGMMGVVGGRWGKKLDRMISIRKSMGDSTTELELSFED